MGHLRVAPVCVLTCIRRLLGRLNRFPHVGQTCLLLSPPEKSPSSLPVPASSGVQPLRLDAGFWLDEAPDAENEMIAEYEGPEGDIRWNFSGPRGLPGPLDGATDGATCGRRSGSGGLLAEEAELELDGRMTRNAGVEPLAIPAWEGWFAGQQPVRLGKVVLEAMCSRDELEGSERRTSKEQMKGSEVCWGMRGRKLVDGGDVPWVWDLKFGLVGGGGDVGVCRGWGGLEGEEEDGERSPYMALVALGENEVELGRKDGTR